MKKIFSELEILTYLRDYTDFISYIITNPTEQFDHLFNIMLTNQNRSQFNELEYYYNMINIADFFLLNKHYSFLKDMFFDYLLDKNIESIALPNTIFINPDDSKYFSKKQTINFIRNALNHSNHKKLYTLLKENNEFYIEINLTKTKPIPFHIKITISEYSKIMSELVKANRMDFKEFSIKKPINLNSKNIYDELDNITYKQYILKSKLDDSIMTKLKLLQEEKKYEEIKTLLKNEGVTIIENQLTPLQKNCTIEEIEKWKNIPFAKTEVILKYTLNKVLASGKSKLEQLSYLLLTNDLYLKDYTKCYNDLMYDILFMKKDRHHYLYSFFKEHQYNNILVRDFDSIMQTAITILMSYIFANLITEEYTKIGGNTYETERLRNSFVHGKWFIGQNGSYKLFDNPPNDLNDLNYTWKASIPFKNMVNFMGNFYNEFYKTEIDKEENKIFLEIPLFLTYSKEDPSLPSYLTFLKKQTKYIFNLSVKDYSENQFHPWNLYKFVDNKLVEVTEKVEQDYFSEELERTSLFQEEIKTIIKEQYKKYLSFKNNLIKIEELQNNEEVFLNYFVNNEEIKVLKKENI